MPINNDCLWEVGWWLLPTEIQLVPSPCWDIRGLLGVSPFRLPNFAHHPVLVVSCSWFFRPGQAGFWLLLCDPDCFTPYPPPHQPRAPHTTGVWFFTSLWTSPLVSLLWLVFAKLVPLGPHFFVPSLVLSATHMPIWPACCCGFLATCSGTMPSVWLLLAPICFFHLPHNLHHPHAFDCSHGRTCHSFLENIQGGGVEWQWVCLPCGRTGRDPGDFADDPALLCYAWLVPGMGDIVFPWRIWLSVFMGNGFTDG